MNSAESVLHLVSHYHFPVWSIGCLYSRKNYQPTPTGTTMIRKKIWWFRQTVMLSTEVSKLTPFLVSTVPDGGGSLCAISILSLTSCCMTHEKVATWFDWLSRMPLSCVAVAHCAHKTTVGSWLQLSCHSHHSDSPSTRSSLCIWSQLYLNACSGRGYRVRLQFSVVF